MNDFDFIRNENPETVFTTLEKEDDYCIALVLSCLSTAFSGTLFGKFDIDRQIELEKLIAKGLNISPSVIAAYAESFKEKLSNQVQEEKNRIAGKEKAVDILRGSTSTVQKDFLKNLAKKDKAFADELREEIFFFDDIPMFHDRDLQVILREVDSPILAKALKTAKKATCEKFYRNMSEKAVSMLKEDMEFMGSIPLKDVLECQQMIVSIILRLGNAGEIVLPNNKEELVR